MKKFLLPLLTILLFTACQKQISTEKTSEEIAGAATNKQTKFTVCHYDAVTGTSKTIEVTQNALSGHLAHGDLQGSCSVVLITICDQDWMIKNLDVDHYRNGDPIPQVTDPSAWAALTTGAWCWYENNSANGTTYGKLYNWYAVNDSRGLAPTGWHIPSDAEWNKLVKCIDPSADTTLVGTQSPTAGGAMKETGTTHWASPNGGATNSSGFTGLPGGYRFTDGISYDVGLTGNWWSSTEDNPFAFYRFLFYPHGHIFKYISFKQGGLSVRCLRD